MMATAAVLLFKVGIPISLFIAMIGMISSIVAIRTLNRRYKNAQWKSVPAFINESSVGVKSYGHGAIVYTPGIRYNYTYEGKDYSSSTITPDLHYNSSRDQEDALKWVELFPAGTAVTVYLDKNNPDVAVLFPDFRYGWWFVIGVTLATFGGCNLLFLILVSDKIFS